MQGFWNTRLSMKSSNYREQFAVFMGILLFKELLRNQHVQVLTDNIITVAMISGIAGSSLQLDMVGRSILGANKVPTSIWDTKLAGGQSVENKRWVNHSVRNYRV